MRNVLILFGTRPELIKLAPVVQALERRSQLIRTTNVSSGQHADLLEPLVTLFGVRVDYDLRLMTAAQSMDELLRKVVSGVSQILVREGSDLIVVQGDTTTSLGGAIAGHNCGVPVAHVEAGLRTGNLDSPYPEEIHRLAITRLTSIHFAATERNRKTLLQEGVSDRRTFVTGNPIVDALRIIQDQKQSAGLDSALLDVIGGRKCIVLTTHRRESLGPVLTQNLRALRACVDQNEELVLVFPVHPNPNVRAAAQQVLAGHPRIVLIPALPYRAFIELVSRSWLVISDSGGIQEEVPSLGKPLLILRENTERPECIEAGMAQLVGGSPETLRTMLCEACKPNSWVNSIHKTTNPFGKGDSGERITNHIVSFLNVSLPREASSLFVPPFEPAISNDNAQ